MIKKNKHMYWLPESALGAIVAAWLVQSVVALFLIAPSAPARTTKSCGDPNQKTIAATSSVRLYETHPGGREQGDRLRVP